MLLAIVALGFMFGALAASLAVFNGAGLLMVLAAYSAAGTLAILVPIFAQFLFHTDHDQELWELEQEDGAQASA